MAVIQIQPRHVKRMGLTPLEFQRQEEAKGNKVHFKMDRTDRWEKPKPVPNLRP